MTVDVVWRRSSRCDGGSCVELAAGGQRVAVRDSTSPAGPVLRFGAGDWRQLLVAIRDGGWVR